MKEETRNQVNEIVGKIGICFGVVAVVVAMLAAVWIAFFAAKDKNLPKPNVAIKVKEAGEVLQLNESPNKAQKEPFRFLKENQELEFYFAIDQADFEIEDVSILDESGFVKQIAENGYSIAAQKTVVEIRYRYRGEENTVYFAVEPEE